VSGTIDWKHIGSPHRFPVPFSPAGSPGLRLQPHIVEADPLELLVDAFDLGAHGVEPEQVGRSLNVYRSPSAETVGWLSASIGIGRRFSSSAYRPSYRWLAMLAVRAAVVQ
jgi:hypothetical protein